MKEKYFEIAYIEAKKAYLEGEIPIGCVIVYNNEIISKAHNLKECNRDATAHAEILAIKEASKKLGDWRLNNCILYTTVKPCMMCMGAIMESRISEVNYLVETDEFKKYYNNLCVNKSNYLENKSLDLLKSFFYSKRK